VKCYACYEQKNFKIMFGCYTNVEQNCIAFLKASGKLLQVHDIHHSRGLCFNGNSNFSILSPRKKSVILVTISFSPSYLYNIICTFCPAYQLQISQFLRSTVFLHRILVAFYSLFQLFPSQAFSRPNCM